MKECLKSPLRNLHEFSGIIKEFKEMPTHIDRHLNEIIFSKCNDRSCFSSFKSKKVQKFFDGNVKFQAHSESDVKGHYKTFIQEVSNTCKKFSDEGQPTQEEKTLGKCEMCPSFGVRPQSEKDRHMRMFHRRQENPKYTCSFESCKRVLTVNSLFLAIKIMSRMENVISQHRSLKFAKKDARPILQSLIHFIKELIDTIKMYELLSSV